MDQLMSRSVTPPPVHQFAGQDEQRNRDQRRLVYASQHRERRLHDVDPAAALEQHAYHGRGDHGEADVQPHQDKHDEQNHRE
nr:hypothetical protein [Achromobacter sp. RTa]